MERKTAGPFYSPGTWLAWILDIRCHNCGLQTASVIFGRCARCGHPSAAKFECSNCGLRTALAKKSLCPACGSPVKDLSAPPPVAEKTPEISITAPSPVSPPVEEIKTVEPVISPQQEEIVPPAEPAAPTVPETKEPPPLLVAPVTEPTLELNPPAMVEAPPAIELPPPQIKAIPIFEEEFPISIEQLDAIFKADSAKADITYKGKLLRVKGAVEQVSTDDLANLYIILGSPDPGAAQKVQCIFDAKYLSVLGRMVVGQKVAVLGRYDVHIIDIRLIDCMPVG